MQFPLSVPRWSDLKRNLSAIYIPDRTEPNRPQNWPQIHDTSSTKNTAVFNDFPGNINIWTTYLQILKMYTHSSIVYAIYFYE